MLLSGVLQSGFKLVLNCFDGAVSSLSPGLVSALGSQIVLQQEWTWLICTRAGAAQCWVCIVNVICFLKCYRCIEHISNSYSIHGVTPCRLEPWKSPQSVSSLPGRGDSAAGAPVLHWRVFPYPVNHIGKIEKTRFQKVR